MGNHKSPSDIAYKARRRDKRYRRFALAIQRTLKILGVYKGHDPRTLTEAK